MKDLRRRRTDRRTRRTFHRPRQRMQRTRRWKRGRNCWKRRRRIMRGCRRRRAGNLRKPQRRGNRKQGFYTEIAERTEDAEKRTEDFVSKDRTTILRFAAVGFGIAVVFVGFQMLLEPS